jgi:hypothetical protein
VFPGFLLQFLQAPTSTNTEVQRLQTCLHLPDPLSQAPHFMFHICTETSIAQNQLLNKYSNKRHRTQHVFYYRCFSYSMVTCFDKQLCHLQTIQYITYIQKCLCR